MMELKSRRARNVAVGIYVLSAALVVPWSAAAADAAKTPTFTRDIAPIFQDKCEACHRPDSIAPMSLMTFTEARPWARSIKARVSDRQMPPWQIDRTVGIQKFKNDRSLTDDQVDTIVRWIDAGAPQGDPKDMPPARQWPHDHASRDRVPRTDRAGRCCRAGSPHAVHGVGRRQAGRNDAPRHGQTAPARFEVPLGYSLLPGW